MPAKKAITKKMNLKVNQEEFFNILKESLMADINRFSENAIKETEIKPGFTYSKTYGNGNKLDVTILKITKPTDYQVRMVGDGHSITSSYHIIRSSSGIDVTYEESTDEQLPDLPPIQQWMKERQIKKILKGIEKVILKNRNAK